MQLGDGWGIGIRMGIYPQPDDVGRLVLYIDGQGKIEEGKIISFNDSYVFVRFGSPTPKACRRQDLEFTNPLREGER
jgi:hypothetical protein